jgi:hypothetical protein
MAASVMVQSNPYGGPFWLRIAFGRVRSDRAKLSLEEFEVARLGTTVESPKFIAVTNLGPVGAISPDLILQHLMVGRDLGKPNWPTS